MLYNRKLQLYIPILVSTLCYPPLFGITPAEIYMLGIRYHEAGEFDKSVACLRSANGGRSASLIELHALRTMNWEDAQETLEPYWWYDAPIAGKTIYIKHDGGVGDAVQFLRYVKHLHDAGAYVMVETPHALAKIYALCPYIDQCISYGTTPHADMTFTISTPKLTFTMRSTLQEASRDVPYIHADQQLVDAWRDVISTLPGPKIGISWCSSPLINKHTQEKLLSPRSIPLIAFDTILQLPYTFVSLQRGYGTEQQALVQEQLIIIPNLDAVPGCFMDTIAIMKHLDLIITVDTSIAHIAGALGVPVWVILPACSDFRWFVSRDDSPWYPTMRLFRQKPGESWESTLLRVHDALLQGAWHV